MKKLTIILLVLCSFGGLTAQNKSNKNDSVKQFFYRDSVIDMQKWYGENKRIDSLKTYHKTGELDESFYYLNNRFHGICTKQNNKGELVTIWEFSEGKLITRTDPILEFNKKNEAQIINFHTDLVALNIEIKETPNKTILRAKRAQLRSRLNDHTLAISDYHNLIRHIIKSSEKKNTPPSGKILGKLYDGLARNYQDLEMDNYAIHYKLKAIKADPENTRLMYNLASFLYEVKAYELALNYLNRVIAEKPEHSFANRLLTAIYSDFENYDKALYHNDIAFKNEASLIKNGDADLQNDIRTQRGYLLHKLGKSNEGIENLNEAIFLNEDNAFAYRNLGVIYYDLEAYNLACENLQKAKELGYEKINDRNDLQSYLNYSCEYVENKALVDASYEAIEMNSFSNKPSIYPNPTKDIVNIKNLPFDSYDFSIFDYTGKLVKQGNNSKKTITISDLPGGVYILKVIHMDLHETFRIIKE